MNLSAEQLYRIRRAHGLTLEQMAEILGVTRSYIGSIERGEYPVTRSIESKTTAAFDLTPNKMRSITMFYAQYIAPHEKKKDGAE